MSSFGVCPRCHGLLQADGGAEGALGCPRCRGSFKAALVKPEPPPEDAGLVDPDAPNCPSCLVPMRSENEAGKRGEPGGVFVCPGCGGNWTDGDPEASQPQAEVEVVPVEEAEGAVSAATKKLLYGLSLPERVVRSAVGLTAGTVKEIAGVIVPQAFQDSTSYEIAIENSLKFLTGTVGGVAGAKELREPGLIDDNSTINSIDELLDALQQASSKTANTLDRPPLSVAELRKTVEEARADLSRADVRKLIPQAELRNYWRQMEQAARQEGVSLLDISTAVTMNTLGSVKTVSEGTLTGVRVAGGLFNTNVFGHYHDSLNRIRERGIYVTLQESYRPYVAAVWENFSGEKTSWTESLLDPRHVTSGVRKIFDLLEGKSGEADG